MVPAVALVFQVSDHLAITPTEELSLRSVVGYLPIVAAPARSRDHRFSLPGSDTPCGSSSTLDGNAAHSLPVRLWLAPPTRAAAHALQFFFDNILQHLII